MIVDMEERPRPRETIWQRLLRDSRDPVLRIAIVTLAVATVSAVCLQKTAQ